MIMRGVFRVFLLISGYNIFSLQRYYVITVSVKIIQTIHCVVETIHESRGLAR